MIRLVPIFLFSLLFACGDAEKTTNSTSTEAVLSEEEYIVKSFSFNCDGISIDSNLVLNTKRCSLWIDSMDQYKHLEEIKQTSDERWMELLQSENCDVARSASIWLYALHGEQLEMLELGMLKDSTSYLRNHQIKFWRTFFEEE